MLLFLGTGVVTVVDGREGDEGDAEVADLGEQAVQLGLVGHGTAKCSCAVVLPGEGEAAEPGRPVLVEGVPGCGARSARVRGCRSAWSGPHRLSLIHI